jgi:hypothetical protein
MHSLDVFNRRMGVYGFSTFASLIAFFYVAGLTVAGANSINKGKYL